MTWTNVPRGHHVVPRGAEGSGEEVFSRRSCLVDHEGGGWRARVISWRYRECPLAARVMGDGCLEIAHQ